MIKKSFKGINWKLLIAIFTTLLIPVIYRTLRMFFIGTMPGTYNFSIAANLQWINILFEVLEEAFLLPLFFTLRNIIKSKNIKERNRKISWQISMISIIYFIAIVFFVIFTRKMVAFLSVQNVTEITIKFIRIEFATRWFIMIGKIGVILLIAKSKWKELILLLLLSTTINVFLDLFISSNNKLSLNKGVMWIGYDQIITSATMALFYILFIYRSYEFNLSHLIPKIFISWKDWRQCLYSGAESFVRNAFFVWFVIKTINKLGNGYNQGDFWVMNSFMWDWLLLPILALSQYLNRDQAFNDKAKPLKERLLAPFIMIGFISLMWIVLIPVYEPFVRVVLNNGNYKIITHLILISLGFYITLAFNDPIDKILFGDGKAHYVLIQSVIVNVSVYIPYFYLTNSISLDGVAIMMGTAIALDSLITFVLFWFWARKKITREMEVKNV